MPLGINLNDRNVDVPLDDWGSGTQNRTRILMAILQAHRIKTTASDDDKITPIVVIEEPESFLHPSAQGEFGRMLRDLSREFGIQIIVTTHSWRVASATRRRTGPFVFRLPVTTGWFPLPTTSALAERTSR